MRYIEFQDVLLMKSNEILQQLLYILLKEAQKLPSTAKQKSTEVFLYRDHLEIRDRALPFSSVALSLLGSLENRHSWKQNSLCHESFS